MANKFDPDEVCQVCGETRENHGDMNHEFSKDGQLRAKKAGPPPQKMPPQPRSQAGVELAKDPTANTMLRLIERLIQKGQLEGTDLMYILGGIDAPNRGSAGNSAASDHNVSDS